MKPAPAWQRRPKKRARLPDLPPPNDTPSTDADRAARAAEWRAECARRAALYAQGGAKALLDAGEITPEVARSAGVEA